MTEHLSQPPAFGGVRQLRVQVGYRPRSDGSALQQYLLDLPVEDEGEGEHPFDDARVLAILGPVLHAGADAPRHYVLHQQRWHTSWRTSPDRVEICLLVTTAASDVVKARDDAVLHAFRDLMELIGRPESEPLSRDDALRRARHSAATAYQVDPDSLWLGAEEHHPDEDSWTVGLRTDEGEQYDVHLGFVDGYAGSARVVHARPIEVSDSLGSE